MGLQTSGQIKASEIANELGITLSNVSLGNMDNNSLGRTGGNKNMSAFYGYTSFASNVLIVGGGGGAGRTFYSSSQYGSSGGGGAGGYLSLTNAITPTENYTIIIGSGGSPYSSKGNDTCIGPYIAYGGGVGGNSSSASCKTGGSGGGGAGARCSFCTAAIPGSAISTTPIQGNNGGGGGAGYGMGCGNSGGGGGGASQVGGGGGGCWSRWPGKGGNGCQWCNGQCYAGGGGGGSKESSEWTCISLRGCGLGGNGGGGVGEVGQNTLYNDCPMCRTNEAGAINTGGGGGGAAIYIGCGSRDGSPGGSGIVIIRYPNTNGYAFSGGNSCSNTGGYIYHCFTSSGTLTSI